MSEVNSSSDESIDTGDPLHQLRDLDLSVPEGFLERVNNRIERRRLSGDLAALLWEGPLILRVEMLSTISALLTTTSSANDSEEGKNS